MQSVVDQIPENLPTCRIPVLRRKRGKLLDTAHKIGISSGSTKNPKHQGCKVSYTKDLQVPGNPSFKKWGKTEGNTTTTWA